MVSKNANFLDLMIAITSSPVCLTNIGIARGKHLLLSSFSRLNVPKEKEPVNIATNLKRGIGEFPLETGSKEQRAHVLDGNIGFKFLNNIHLLV